MNNEKCLLKKQLMKKKIQKNNQLIKLLMRKIIKKRNY